MSVPALLAPLTPGQRDGLRAALARARAEYGHYHEVFTAAGVDAALVAADPLAALQRLPVFDPAAMARLSEEALRGRAHDLGGIELTSGTTTGIPKRRILSEADLAIDAALVTRLLHLAGVRAADRVAAIDLAVTPLSAAFLEGCERLGVRATAGLSLGARIDPTPLLHYNPTVLIGPPALLIRIGPALTSGSGFHPRLVIYNGERLPAAIITALHEQGVATRSLYGLTETSALGVACGQGEGLHLATGHALYETRAVEEGHELIVTTTGYSMPLLRYPTGDLVRLLPGRCSCGSPWPRVHILGRLGDRFGLFDVKFRASELAALLLERPDGSLQVILSRGDAAQERMTLRLPPSYRPRRRELERRLRGYPQLDYLLANRLVRLRFQFDVAPAHGRKIPAVVDRRA